MQSSNRFKSDANSTGHKIDNKEKRRKKKRDVSTMMENNRSPFSQPNLTNDTLKERQEHGLLRQHDYESNTII